MAHPQPDPAVLARRLSSLAKDVWTLTADRRLNGPHLIALETLWASLAQLADEMSDAATPCDVPDCPGRPDHTNTSAPTAPLAVTGAGNRSKEYIP